MYTAIDVINLKADIEAFSTTKNNILNELDSLKCCFDRIEYFLDHYKDSDLQSVDDLPL